MTLMWCAFAGPPQILRAYGTAQIFHANDARFAEFAEIIPAPTGARQYLLVDIDLVQTSCGYAVPTMDYVEDRKVLAMWADKRGPDGIADYWQEKNRFSIDGMPTGMPQET